MRLWKNPPARPPPEEETVAARVIDALPDELDTVDEVSKVFQRWLEESLMMLAAFLALHLLVRLASRVVGHRPSSTTKLGIKMVLFTIWGVVLAIFPEAAPTPTSASKLKGLVKQVAQQSPKEASLLGRTYAKVSSLIHSIVGYIAMDMAMAAVLPAAIPLEGVPRLFVLPSQCLFAVLVGARIVTPLSHAVRAVCDDAIEEWVASDKEAHGSASCAYDHLAFIPTALAGMLWAVWGAMLLGFFGVDVTGFWQSLGASGLLIGLALQHYAADMVAGFTLLADGRFKLGEMITVGGVGTITVRQVGVLQTRCTALDAGQAVSVPNSLLAKASIVNEARIGVRRINPAVVVDSSTPAELLLRLPLALRDAAKAALKKAGLADGVVALEEAMGGGAMVLTGADVNGITFVLTLAVKIKPPDVNRWKRVHTVALLGMCGELERLKVRLGRRFPQPEEGSNV